MNRIEQSVERKGGAPSRRGPDGEPAAAGVAPASSGTRLHRLWRRSRHGWPARFPVAQFPNAPLLIAAGGWLAASLTDGPVHAFGRATFYAGLSAWAWGELSSGVNWFRRALGAAGLAYVVVVLGSALAARG